MAKGKLTRLSSIDAAATREYLTLALYSDPVEQTQRETFAQMLPQIFGLRQQGVDFKTITKLLNECGLKLQASTTRAYYSKFLEFRSDECEEWWRQNQRRIEEIRQETKGLEIDRIPEAVVKITARRKDQEK